MRQSVDFKIYLLMYKCLHQARRSVPLVDDESGFGSLTRHHLRSIGQGDLIVHRTKTAGFGPRSFPIAAPLAWNSLPSEIKTTSLTLGQFFGRLKTGMHLRSYYASAQPS